MASYNFFRDWSSVGSFLWGVGCRRGDSIGGRAGGGAGLEFVGQADLEAVEEGADEVEEGLGEEAVEPVLETVAEFHGAGLFGDFGESGEGGGFAVGLAHGVAGGDVPRAAEGVSCEVPDYGGAFGGGVEGGFVGDGHLGFAADAADAFE